MHDGRGSRNASPRGAAQGRAVGVGTKSGIPPCSARPLLPLAILIAVCPSARADFTLSTSVAITGGDVSSVNTLPMTGSFTIGGTPVPFTDGGLVVQTTGGATVFFFNGTTTATGSAATQELINVAAPLTDAEETTITFTQTFGVTGPGAGLFTESNTLAIFGPAAPNNPWTANLSVQGSLDPPSQVIAGDNYTVATYSTQGGSIDDATMPVGIFATIQDTGPAGSANVPEPSSLALCGVGLLGGIVAFARGRRLGRAKTRTARA